MLRSTTRRLQSLVGWKTIRRVCGLAAHHASHGPNGRKTMTCHFAGLYHSRADRRRLFRTGDDEAARTEEAADGAGCSGRALCSTQRLRLEPPACPVSRRRADQPAQRHRGEGRDALGALFAGFCNDPKDGGLKGFNSRSNTHQIETRLRPNGWRPRHTWRSPTEAPTPTSPMTGICRRWSRRSMPARSRRSRPGRTIGRQAAPKRQTAPPPTGWRSIPPSW